MADSSIERLSLALSGMGINPQIIYQFILKDRKENHESSSSQDSQ